MSTARWDGETFPYDFNGIGEMSPCIDVFNQIAAVMSKHRWRGTTWKSVAVCSNSARASGLGEPSNMATSVIPRRMRSLHSGSGSQRITAAAMAPGCRLGRALRSTSTLRRWSRIHRMPSRDRSDGPPCIHATVIRAANPISARLLLRSCDS